MKTRTYGDLTLGRSGCELDAFNKFIIHINIALVIIAIVGFVSIFKDHFSSICLVISLGSIITAIVLKIWKEIKPLSPTSATIAFMLACLCIAACILLIVFGVRAICTEGWAQLTATVLGLIALAFTYGPRVYRYAVDKLNGLIAGLAGGD